MNRYGLNRLCVVVSAILFVLAGCGQQSTVPDTARTVVTADGQAGVQKAPADQSGPRITFEKTIYDFGEIGASKTFEGQFKFTNTGSGVLKIANVESCCGAVVTLDRQELAPGESGLLKVQYNSGPRDGLFSKRLHVNSNDPTNARVTLTISGQVLARVAWQPRGLSLVFNKENAGCPEITITSLDQRPFAIKAFQSTEKVITAEVDPSAQATKFVLQPKVDLEKLRKQPTGMVAITLTHPDLDRVSIPFVTKPRFQLRPDSLVLLDPTPQQPITNRVSLLSNYGEDLEIESTSSEKGTMRVLSQRAIAGGYQLVVEVTPPARHGTGGFTDAINIQLKNGEELSLKCYIRYPAVVE